MVDRRTAQQPCSFSMFNQLAVHGRWEGTECLQVFVASAEREDNFHGDADRESTGILEDFSDRILHPKPVQVCLHPCESRPKSHILLVRAGSGVVRIRHLGREDF